MKQIKSLGLLASALLLSLSSVSVGAAGQYDTGGYPESRESMEQKMEHSDTHKMDQERGARGPIRSGLVECKDSLACQQKNPGWTEFQGYIKPLTLVDPETGIPAN